MIYRGHPFKGPAQLLNGIVWLSGAWHLVLIALSFAKILPGLNHLGRNNASHGLGRMAGRVEFLRTTGATTCGPWAR
jgi:hypothetical protein